MWGAAGWIVPALAALGLSLASSLTSALLRSAQFSARGRAMQATRLSSLLYFIALLTAIFSTLLACAIFIYLVFWPPSVTDGSNALLPVLYGLVALQSLVYTGLNSQGFPQSWSWLPFLILEVFTEVMEGLQRVHVNGEWRFRGNYVGVTLLCLGCLHTVYFYAALFYSIFPPSARSSQVSERTPLLINDEANEVAPQASDQRLANKRSQSETDYGWLSNVLFLWIKPLLAVGSVRPLLFADLLPLPLPERTAHLAAKFHHSVSTHPGALMSALHSVFALPYYPLALWKLAADSLGFVGPLILNQLVLYVQQPPQQESHTRGYLWASLLSLTVLGQAFASTQYNFAVNRIALRVRTALITAVYAKTLKISSGERSRIGSGELTNLMSTDVDRVTNFCSSFHEFWSLPLQIVVCLYLLHTQIGISFLAGLGFAIALIPLNRYIANKIHKASEAMMKEKDARVQLTSEVLSGMRLLKYLAWEHRFAERIISLRSGELRHLASRKYLDAWCVFFWACTPVLITSVTLGTYLIIHHGELPSAAVLFTSLALFNMLIGPLNAFPWVVNGLVEAYVSHKRIDKLLATQDHAPRIGLRDLDPEIPHNYGSLPAPPGSSLMIELRHAGWRWPNTSVGVNVDASFRCRELTAVLGSFGSGKSSLLHALAGDMLPISGQILVHHPLKSIAIATQDCWLEGGTVRANMRFATPPNAKWEATVLEACGIAHLADAESGPSGARLSGGERARVALARVIYCRPRVALLDDVLASLDGPLARKVFAEAILDLLRDRVGACVLFATNQLHLVPFADQVIVMENGESKFVGPHKELQQTDLLALLGDSPAARKPIVNEVESKEKVRGEDERKAAEEERTVAGELASSTYKVYAIAIGTGMLLLVATSLLLMQASRNVSDWWLSFWITRSNENDAPLSLFGGVYIGLACANALFTLARSFSFAYAGLCAAEKLHANVLTRVLTAPLSFFIATPAGRILNRLSSDVWAVDDSLPFIANILCASLVGLMGTAILLAAATPLVLLLYIPTAILYFFVQRYYRRTSREVKRLDSASRSPVYSHFSQSLLGATTLVSFGIERTYERANEKLLDVNQQAVYAAACIGGWLTAHLQLLGVIVVSGVAFAALIQHHLFPGSIAPALVGLAVAYALPVTGLLNGSITSFTETEKQMIAVERMEEYTRLTSEHDVAEDDGKVSSQWPSLGSVEFDCVTVEFPGGGGLREVSIRIEGGMRVGICGRSGAGKTTLVNAIFRIALPTSGRVFIDRVATDRVPLRRLRSALCVVPQQPFLFKGTVRYNLDPFDRESDQSIWAALEKAHMRDVIAGLEGGLDAQVAERGSNLSAGQRQLLCLARAILIKAKIVCVDEATANVDLATDALVQQTLSREFRDSTLIIIAHRINTLMSCDRIAVLDSGAVVEYDKPERLQSTQWRALSNEK